MDIETKSCSFWVSAELSNKDLDSSWGLPPCPPMAHFVLPGMLTVTPLFNVLCFAYCLWLSTSWRAGMNIISSPLHGRSSASVLATPGGKGSWIPAGPSWAPTLCHAWNPGGAGMSLPFVQMGKPDRLKLCTGSVQLQRQARLCGAGVPSSGHHAPHSAPRPEMSKVRLAAVDWQGSSFLEPSAVQPAAAPPPPG